MVKLEVIGDQKTLLPDNDETLRPPSAGEGRLQGPAVYPDDLIMANADEAGWAAVMPLAAPIGSGMGVRTRQHPDHPGEGAMPVIVDAGVGTASDAAIAMELGCDAVLMNTAHRRGEGPGADGRGDALRLEAGYLAAPRRQDPAAPLRQRLVAASRG